MTRVLPEVRELIESARHRVAVLLHGGQQKLALEILDEGCDVEGLHVGELADTARAAPLRETARRVEIGPACVVVVDLRSEELEDALRGLRRGCEEHGRLQRGSGDSRFQCSWLSPPGHHI